MLRYMLTLFLSLAFVSCSTTIDDPSTINAVRDSPDSVSISAKKIPGGFGYTVHALPTRTQFKKKIAITTDDEIVTVSAAKLRFASEWSKKYGKLSDGAGRLESMGIEVPLSYAIPFDPDVLPPEILRRKLKSIDPNSVVRDQWPHYGYAAALPSEIREAGLHRLDGVRTILIGAPFARAPAQSAIEEGATAYARTFTSFNNASSLMLDPAPPNGGAVPYDRDYFGEGVRVGIVEPISKNSDAWAHGIWDGHETFSVLDGGQVFHRVTPPACSTDADCAAGGACQPMSSGHDRCVARHPTAVASRIANFHPELPGHAAKVRLYFANGENPIYTTTDPSDFPAAENELAERYNWLRRRGVEIVNESFSNYDEDTSWNWDDGIQDSYDQVAGYANYHADLQTLFTLEQDMLFVMAAGNGGTQKDSYSSLCGEVHCQSPHTLCVGGAKTNGSGNLSEADKRSPYADDPDQYLDDFFDDAQFSWRNPLTEYVWDRRLEDCTLKEEDGIPRHFSDIERPDVGSEALKALVAEHDGQADGWDRRTGTSYSAPTITGFAALLRDCKGARRYPSYYISRLRNFAYRFRQTEQPNEWFYPTPGRTSLQGYCAVSCPLGYACVDNACMPANLYASNFLDSRNGTGILDGHSLLPLCNLAEDGPGIEPEDKPRGNLPQDDQYDGDRVAGATVEFFYGEGEPAPSSINASQQSMGSKTQQSHQTTTFPLQWDGGPSLAYFKLFDFGGYGLLDGREIRLSMTHTCEGDLDIAICDDPESVADPSCYLASQSVHDTNEGFHETLDLGGMSSISDPAVLVLWEEGAEQCNFVYEPVRLSWSMLW